MSVECVRVGSEGDDADRSARLPRQLFAETVLPFVPVSPPTAADVASNHSESQNRPLLGPEISSSAPNILANSSENGASKPLAYLVSSIGTISAAVDTTADPDSELHKTVSRLQAEVNAQVTIISKLRAECQTMRDVMKHCTCGAADSLIVHSISLPNQHGKRDYPDQAHDLAFLMRTTPSPLSSPTATLSPPRLAGVTATASSSSQVVVVSSDEIDTLKAQCAHLIAENTKLNEKVKAYQVHVQMLSQQQQQPQLNTVTGPVRPAVVAGSEQCCPQKSKRIQQQQRLIEEKAELVRSMRETLQWSSQQIAQYKAENAELTKVRDGLLGQVSNMSRRFAQEATQRQVASTPQQSTAFATPVRSTIETPQQASTSPQASAVVVDVAVAKPAQTDARLKWYLPEPPPVLPPPPQPQQEDVGVGAIVSMVSHWFGWR